MNFLFYRYNSICEPYMINSLQSLGHTIKTIDTEITWKNVPARKVVEIVSDILLQESFDGLISVNYYPVLSEICRIFKLRYLSWTVDSPVLELLSDTISNEYNRLFLFDYQQYQDLVMYNPDNIFYLPLATNTTHWDNIINSSKNNSKYQSDISFVGSLYTEKCPYDNIIAPSKHLSGYLDGIMAAQDTIYGYFFLDEVLPDSIIQEFIQCMPNYYIPPERARRDNAKIIALQYLGMKISSTERIKAMTLLGSQHHVDIYTASDTTGLPVHNHGCAKTLTEMPLIFHYSKINLNITCKSIRSGISQRIWDILGCGGFCLTNYQTEIPEHFVIGEDLDTYGSLDELLDKTNYYLSHEEIRTKIAQNGYQKVKQFHTYDTRISQMIELAFSV